ncbi:hypothetical protein GCM10027063_33880 [Promicromonospora xylanilytica]
MKSPGSNKAVGEFISSSPHHWPRIDKSLNHLTFGLAMFLPGLYLALNNLPETSSRLAQLTLSGIPTTFGGISIFFGCVGLATAVRGSVRKGDDAIDLKLSSRGITVRGGQEIPWDSIARVTDIRYSNHAAIQLLWDRADLNSAFMVHLKEPLDIPGIRTKDGEHRLKINVLRYPAVDYKPLYESVVAEFERRRIPVDTERTTKET